MTALQMGYLTGRREVAYRQYRGVHDVHALARGGVALRVLRAIRASLGAA
jgi:hypothetical protein